MAILANGMNAGQCGGGGGGAERLFATPPLVALVWFMMTASFDVEEISADWRGDGEGDAKDFLATLSLAALRTVLRRSRSRRIWSRNAEEEHCAMRAGVLNAARRNEMRARRGCFLCCACPEGATPRLISSGRSLRWSRIRRGKRACQAPRHRVELQILILERCVCFFSFLEIRAMGMWFVAFGRRALQIVGLD